MNIFGIDKSFKFTSFFLLFNLILLFKNKVNCQQCNAYTDLFANINKYDPMFDSNAYTISPSLSVKPNNYIKNILSFQLFDNDTQSFDVNQFTLSTNDSRFTISQDLQSNKFQFNYDNGELFYNVNNAHRYVVELTACDKGVPSRCSTADVVVPLINYNSHPPTYKAPVLIYASITLTKNSQLGQLNAFDVDGDKITYSIHSSNPQAVKNTIDVTPDGSLVLKDTLTPFTASFTVIVQLTDDGSCCAPPVVTLSSQMTVNIFIVEVNMYSPVFVANTNGDNYCAKKYQVDENKMFQIEIVARDDDQRGKNGLIDLYPVDAEGNVPQNSFGLNTQFAQTGRTRKAIVYNKEPFDYERPKYGTNSMYIMFYAKDQGDIPRTGYCYMQIEILDVNDNVPVFAQSSINIYINEGYKVRTWSYRFIATDADSGENGRVEYYFQNNVDPNILAVFDLNATTGILTIKDPTILSTLPNKFSFSIYGQDCSSTRNKSDPLLVNIFKSKLLMLPPYFSNFPENGVLSKPVSEMTSRGTILQTFQLTMQTDTTNQVLRCYLSPKPSPEWFLFSFKATSGVLNREENCSLSVIDTLSYEYAQSVVIYMVAELANSAEGVTARELKILTINLQDENINAPKFLLPKLQGSVVEGDGDLNKTILVVQAYDLDKTPPYNTISYSFDPVQLDSTSYFSLNSSTGEIKLIKPIKNLKGVYFNVIAKDGANGWNQDEPNSATIYVDIRVIDINDNPPRFTQNNYVFNITEGEQSGFVLGQMDAVDEDADTNFNFSISDPTFGIRSIYISSRATLYNQQYKGSAEIYLNTFVDYSVKSQYVLTAYVSDSFFVNQTQVTINVINKNDHPPVFVQDIKDGVTVQEKKQTGVVVARLDATDLDPPPQNFFYQAYSTPYLNKSWFNLDPKTGVLTLTQGLDRDAPFGQPIHYLPVSVSDLGGSAPDSLTSYRMVKIILTDINDHGPRPVYKVQRPLIINEGDPTGSVDLYFVDVDDPTNNGPPCTVKLETYSDIFDIRDSSLSQADKDAGRCPYSIILKGGQTLNRDIQKYYDIKYTASDRAGISETGVLRLVVGDVADKNYNSQFSASKQVTVMSLEGRIPTNAPLSTLYVYDKDDWQREKKSAKNCVAQPANLFSVSSNGLYVSGPTQGNNFQSNNKLTLECTVVDQGKADAQAKVDFVVDNVDYGDIFDLTGVRVLGLTSDELLYKNTTQDTSKYDTLVNSIKTILSLNNDGGSFKVVTVRDYKARMPRNIDNAIQLQDPNTYGCEVYFTARQNNKIISSLKAVSLLSSQLTTLGNYKVQTVSELCSQQTSDFCPTGLYCNSIYVLKQGRQIADGNASALVGLNGYRDATCFCDVAVPPKSCYNGGTYVSSGNGFYCTCPDGFEGPRCELTTLTFEFLAQSTSHSYSLYQNFKLCDPTRIELEFTTERQRGLLLFNGPVNRDAFYYIAILILNGKVVIRFGNSSLTLDTNVADKNWHKLDLSISQNVIQANLDECASTNADFNNKLLNSDKQSTDNVQLSLGGIPPDIPDAHFYYGKVDVFEYEGCIRNVLINGQLRDLALKRSNLAKEQCDCKYQSKFTSSCVATAPVVKSAEFPWWIILIVVAALILLATILGLAVCTIKRKDSQKKILQMFPDDDIRETIINYADGAGEENTDNFDINGMKIPIGVPKPVVPTPTPTRVITDPTTNDQYLIFANEGEGSDAGSLSSVNTDTGEQEVDFDYLSQWGPKFNKLSSLYNTYDANDPDNYNNRAYTSDFSPRNTQIRN